MDYQTFKMIQTALDENYTTASRLRAEIEKPYGKGPMGLTSEEAWKDPKYRAARQEQGEMFGALRAFNGAYAKKFMKEQIAEMKAIREARLKEILSA